MFWWRLLVQRPGVHGGQATPGDCKSVTVVPLSYCYFEAPGPGQFASNARSSRNKAPFLDDPRPLESFIRQSYTRRTRKSEFSNDRMLLRNFNAAAFIRVATDATPSFIGKHRLRARVGWYSVLRGESNVAIVPAIGGDGVEYIYLGEFSPQFADLLPQVHGVARLSSSFHGCCSQCA